MHGAEHDDDDDPFTPRHGPEQFSDPRPLKCPTYEQDPTKTCPFLHCCACKFKLARGLEDDDGTTVYSCLACDAVYVTTGH